MKDTPGVYVAKVVWQPEKRDSDSMRIVGHAAVFNTPSKPIGGPRGFKETLASGCFSRALNRPGADQFLLWSHDDAEVLARRSAGTLNIREDTRGLAFSADVVPTSRGRDAVTLVRTGHVRECSFAFTVEDDEWTHGADGKTHRLIREVGELFEISLVASPAYTGTEATAERELERERELIEIRSRAEARLTQLRKGKMAAPRIQARERSEYGPDSPHSWFRDRLISMEAQERSRAIAHDPSARNWKFGSGGFSSPDLRSLDLSVEAAERRLSVAATESRALSNAAGAGGEFFPAHGLPTYLAAEFATSAQNEAVVASVLRHEALPAGGMHLEVPQLGSSKPSGTAATVAIQTTEGSTPSSTDPSTALVSADIITVAGQNDVDRQLFDRALPGLDSVLARELGKALGAAIETEILNGPGTALRLRGLLNVSGVTADVYTDASPTGAKVLNAIAQLASDVTSALGRLSGLVAIMHPRRYLHTGSHASAVLGDWPVRPVAAPAIPTNLGAGTNQDVVIVLDPQECPLFLGDIRFLVMQDVLSSNLRVRFQAVQYVGAVFHRLPAAIGTLSGTGLAAPTW